MINGASFLHFDIIIITVKFKTTILIVNQSINDAPE